MILKVNYSCEIECYDIEGKL